jgi:hypothetical protein
MCHQTLLPFSPCVKKSQQRRPVPLPQQQQQRRPVPLPKQQCRPGTAAVALADPSSSSPPLPFYFLNSNTAPGHFGNRGLPWTIRGVAPHLLRTSQRRNHLSILASAAAAMCWRCRKGKSGRMRYWKETAELKTGYEKRSGRRRRQHGSAPAPPRVEDSAVATHRQQPETRGGSSVSVPLQPGVPGVYFWGTLGLSPSWTGLPNGPVVVFGGSKLGRD